MATETTSTIRADKLNNTSWQVAGQHTAESAIRTALRPLASLRLTVALFALSIVLVFVGTLAQVEQNMWEVLDGYFQTWFAWIEFRTFVPVSFFPGRPDIAGGCWFPGGYLIGLLLGLNLCAAHAVRFTVQAKGMRLWSGWCMVAAGVLLTAVIIFSGHRQDGLQGLPVFSWDTLWTVLVWLIAGGWLVSLAAVVRMDRSRRLPFWLAALGCGCYAAVSVTLLLQGTALRPSDPSMRILWQLIQGQLAALVLLAGCLMVFKRRGAIVLIHAGVGLLMFGQLLAGITSVEEQVTLSPGESTSFARETRKIEIAVVDRADPQFDQVVAVPASMWMSGEVVSDPRLPFDLQVVDFLKNSRLDDAPTTDNPATAGVGRKISAVKLRSAGGADTSGAMDLPAAYVTVMPRSDRQAAETYLLASQLGDGSLFPGQRNDHPETVEVNGRSYEVSLRFRRNYKPYSLKLRDVVKDDYLGTDTPRDYSSYVDLDDPSRDFRRENIRIWMNNPLRYAGETFYQSGFNELPNGTRQTTLQVVTNTGWMIPYLACMLVSTGLLAHFGGVLVRFLRRRTEQLRRLQSSRPPARVGKRRPSTAPIGGGLAATVVPLLTIAVAALVIATAAMPKQLSVNGMQLHEFGKLPVVYGGRAKPLDTLARNALRIMSIKQTLKDPDVPRDDKERAGKTSAVRWLLDVIAQNEAGDDHAVFRIENLDVQQLLELPRRKGFLYSPREIRDGLARFDAEVSAAYAMRQSHPEDLTAYHRKLIESADRIRTFSRIQSSFRPLPYPPPPSQQLRQEDPAEAQSQMDRLIELAGKTKKFNQMLLQQRPPLVVPVGEEQAEWQPFAAAANVAYLQRLFGEQPDERLIAWSQIIGAYDRGDAREFNTAVAAYRGELMQNPPPGVDMQKIEFESFFNSFQPFMVAMILYVIVFLLAAVGWLGWFRPLNQAAFYLAICTFVLHTFALAARIYISGRPPVTNLYSSAIFIGWACVLMGLIVEGYFRLSIGNILAAVGGFATLLIAHNLAGDGDTFTVLQAVLDTQFWLATHVVCITLGYAATFAAGGLAMIYVVARLAQRFGGRIPVELGATLYRMTYGIVCFAIFFSFVGTVLGGLWADDSWGRFWGWDPKENGALIIVLWNALMLHARWGGMVRERGFAVLAIAGNIVTAWSWFGVNELGIGLHSYGFTEGVLLYLGLFVLVNLLWMAAGCLLPKPAKA